MNYFKNKSDNLLEELEKCRASQHEDNGTQWHKLIFRPLMEDEKEFYTNCTEYVENLPNFGEEVLVTDGTNVWVDSFDIDDFVYLSGTDNDIDGVIAWMELPEPYKEEQ
jgi:hypothetical protein